jgi:flagellar L-ring protein precursor FlgH
MRRTVATTLMLCCVSLLALNAHAGKDAKKKKPTADDLRAQYVARLSGKNIAVPDEHTLGSLWTSDGALNDISTDYKAKRLNDTITIIVSVQTTAAQSGSVNTSRAFAHNSAITGVMGQTPSVLNPLLAANSTTTLKGSGQTASSTAFQTSLTGQVIAVLPNGNLIVEAHREIFMNNQHEDVTVRGLLRPGDIGPQNAVPSSALANLEIEMKGKGIISDGTRPPNPITKAILWLFGF